jgi:integrase/recombinase XerD
MNLTDIKLLLSLPKRELEEKNNCAFSEINFSQRQNRKYTTVLQNAVILELLFATGMRVFELSNLHTDDIDLIRRVVRINGKGSRQRIVPIPNDEIVKLLISYMGIERIQMENQRWLLTNRLNRRMKTQSIRTVVRKYVDKAQLNRRITPHTFRHTTATMLIENGTDIRFVQSLLGHNSIVTTQLYIHVAEATQRRIITLNHPRNLF